MAWKHGSVLWVDVGSIFHVIVGSILQVDVGSILQVDVGSPPFPLQCGSTVATRAVHFNIDMRLTLDEVAVSRAQL